MNVFKNGYWGSYRHQILKEVKQICTHSSFPEEFSTAAQNAFVDVLTPGDFSSLQWVDSPVIPTSLERCTVHYSSLNFHDVVLASGKLPVEALPGEVIYSVCNDRAHKECLIGVEFAGYDSKGKRVMGVVENEGLALEVFAEPHLLFDVPESWSLEDAATVPIVYSTVYYALVVRGQIERGDSILIHAGSGGVGQAAIAVALSYGCKIYTTIGGYIAIFRVINVTQRSLKICSKYICPFTTVSKPLNYLPMFFPQVRRKNEFSSRRSSPL
ncbi:Fatty acid synthase [Holothuria leucospilota]|uniref:Fatty acid synthase n=1 Tax=Holothuria leucospilota TaxID=206669 RepID=A0A9Q1H1S0_HOLLE|nr:Fatty acid synthase [Holothuria leucospilota]